MSTQEFGQFIGRDARRTVPYLNLNAPPPTENIAPAELSRGSRLQLHTSIEVIDDDIAIIDQRTFTEAVNNAGRNHSQFGLRDVTNQAGERMNRHPGLPLWYRKTNNNVSIGDFLMSFRFIPRNVPESPKLPQNPAATEAPALRCPICMGPVKEAITTKCGHIFCKECIGAAMACRKKCPTCRKKVAKNSIIRIYP